MSASIWLPPAAGPRPSCGSTSGAPRDRPDRGAGGRAADRGSRCLQRDKTRKCQMSNFLLTSSRSQRLRPDRSRKSCINRPRLWVNGYSTPRVAIAAFRAFSTACWAWNPVLDSETSSASGDACAEARSLRARRGRLAGATRAACAAGAPTPRLRWRPQARRRGSRHRCERAPHREVRAKEDHLRPGAAAARRLPASAISFSSVGTMVTVIVAAGRADSGASTSSRSPPSPPG